MFQFNSKVAQECWFCSYSFYRRDGLSKEEILNLASFLGEQLRNLHFLPLPPLKNSTFLDSKPKIELPHGNNGFLEEDTNNKIRIPAEWEVSIRTLNRKKKDVTSRLTKWYVRVSICYWFTAFLCLYIFNFTLLSTVWWMSTLKRLNLFFNYNQC